jgi:hypothetical protein
MLWDSQWEFSIGGLAFAVMMLAHLFAVVVLNRKDMGDSQGQQPRRSPGSLY